jgi:hypothetical protein
MIEPEWEKSMNEKRNDKRQKNYDNNNSLIDFLWHD